MRAIYEIGGEPRFIVYSDPRYMSITWERVGSSEIYVTVIETDDTGYVATKARFLGPDNIPTN